jgi:SAM-dependent methyltransferase
MGDGVGGAGGEGVMQERMTRDQVIERLRFHSGGHHSDTLQGPLGHILGGGAWMLEWSREDDLPTFWRGCGYKVFAEIGVERAKYTKHLLTTMPHASVAAVDPWLAYGGYREHVTQSKLDGFYAETQARLAEFGGRAKILRETSVEAATCFPDNSFDVVYIDGNHTLPYVIADLHAWVRKVRPGGMVCGHDWGRRRVGHVKEAVEAWVAAYDVGQWFLFTKDRSWSWGFVK